MLGWNLIHVDKSGHWCRPVSRGLSVKPGNWSSETPKSTVTISAIGEEESFCSFACHTRANEGTNIRPVGVWLSVIRLFRYIQIDMGQVMELWLSCYLVCYQLIAKPGNKTAAVSWPGPYSVDIHIATNTFLSLNQGTFCKDREYGVNKMGFLSIDETAWVWLLCAESMT